MTGEFQNSAVGVEIIKQIAGVTDLLHSLAIAICGGTLALLWKVVEAHSSSPTTRPPILKYRGTIIAGLVLLGLSVLLGILVRGCLLSDTPLILGLPFSAATPFDEMQKSFPNGLRLSLISASQQSSFAIGTILLAVAFSSTFFGSVGPKPQEAKQAEDSPPESPVSP